MKFKQSKIPMHRISCNICKTICLILFSITFNAIISAAQSGFKFTETTIELCATKNKSRLKSNIEVLDGRIYKQEIGKLISFEKNKWIKLTLTPSFLESMIMVNDSLATKLNMTQSYLIKVNSFYIQENKIKGTSLKFAKFHYQADYYAKNKGNTYELIYSADSSHFIQSYLLQVSLVTDLKSAMYHHLVRCKNSSLRSPAKSITEIIQQPKLPEQFVDVFTESKHDGVFTTWEELRNNQPQYSFARLKGISKLGQLQFVDTLRKKKINLSLFSMYAFLKQGILYKCSRFGSFPLLNIQNIYFYVGIHEQFYTFKPDAYQYRKLDKLGGFKVNTEDIESQKYLFKIDPLTGKSIVICSITPADDYTSILMKLDLKD